MILYYERRSILVCLYEYYCGMLGKLFGELYDVDDIDISRQNKKIDKVGKKAKRIKTKIRCLDRKFLDSL